MRFHVRGIRAVLALSALGLGLLAAGAALSGCERKVTLSTVGDTTAVVPPDSLQELFGEVRRAWEQGGDDEAASRLTAKALFHDLHQHDASQWSARAQDLLDSLGVGSETSGGRCALIVNLFLRSEPTRGSWPYLYWCDPKAQVKWQAIEGKGMRLLGSETLRDPEGSGPTPGRVAALYARSKAGRSEPILYVWGRRGKSQEWDVVETLGPDSLGGYGSGAFETHADSVDLVVRTYRPLPRFDECATCPHAYWNHSFRWTADGFERRSSAVVPSPYGTFVRFVTALTSGTADPLEYVSMSTVVEQARALEWDRPKGTWRVAPGSETDGDQLRLFRGTTESYRVEFETRGPDWVIRGIELVPRSAE